MNYPAWSQNIIMMLDAEVDGKVYTIGMVSAYHCNYRNMTAKVGILIDKEIRNQKVSSKCIEEWLTYLFERSNFRKLSAEVVEERLAAAMVLRGAEKEGCYKNEVNVDGHYVNELRYGLLRENYTPVCGETKKRPALSLVNPLDKGEEESCRQDHQNKN